MLSRSGVGAWRRRAATKAHIMTTVGFDKVDSASIPTMEVSSEAWANLCDTALSAMAERDVFAHGLQERGAERDNAEMYVEQLKAERDRLREALALLYYDGGKPVGYPSEALVKRLLGVKESGENDAASGGATDTPGSGRASQAGARPDHEPSAQAATPDSITLPRARLLDLRKLNAHLPVWGNVDHVLWGDLRALLDIADAAMEAETALADAMKGIATNHECPHCNTESGDHQSDCPYAVALARLRKARGA